MRIAFFGTPKISSSYVAPLAGAHELVCAVTQPDRPRGRSATPRPSPVKEAVGLLGAPVLQPPPGQCQQACEALQQCAADVCVVVAFGQMLPCGRYDGCNVGTCINVHYSLLPDLRGAAPVQHAILQGLAHTGVTIQHVAPGLDEGDIILQATVQILPGDSSPVLMDRLTQTGVPLLLQALELIGEGRAPRIPQDHSQATYAPSIRKADGHIDWHEDAVTLERKVRAFQPWPGVMTRVNNKVVKVLAARADVDSPEQEGERGRIVEMRRDGAFAVSCGSGRLWVEEVQPAGKKRMRAADYLRGARLEIGAQFG